MVRSRRIPIRTSRAIRLRSDGRAGPDTDGRTDTDGRAGTDGRAIARIALPSLIVLVAEPLYVLFDLAVVGRLGTDELAGLAVGGMLLSLVAGQATFLAYGTTARVSNRFGARDRPGALGEAITATWLAAALGAILVAGFLLAGGPVSHAVAGDSRIGDDAAAWLTVACLGAPGIALALAGNGWLRGLQRTRLPVIAVSTGFAVSAVLCPALVFGWGPVPRLGLVGSAWANVVGQTLAATIMLGALVAAVRGQGRVPLRPQRAVLLAQLGLARDLIARSLAFQLCFLSAGIVAARFGAAAVSAHQIAMQLWSLVALILDSVAVAAQTLVGAALGGADRARAKAIAKTVIVWSTAVAGVIAVACAAGFRAIPELMSNDDGVIDAIGPIWWIFVALIPVAGIVFALDGILLGAADARYLRTTTLAGAILGYLPLIWIALALDTGLRGIWIGLAVFMLARLTATAWRVRSGVWLVGGAG